MRLTEREWLETKREFGNVSGRPRHLYRLTADGRRRALATERERGGLMRLLRRSQRGDLMSATRNDFPTQLLVFLHDRVPAALQP